MSHSNDLTVRVWDANNRKCIRVIEHVGDFWFWAGFERTYLELNGFLFARNKPVWRTFAEALETSIALREIVAWFPVSLHLIVNPSFRSTWAGAAGEGVYILSLEDAVPEKSLVT